MRILTDKRERSRFLKFSLVGTIGAAVDFLAFNLFNSLAGLAAVPSSILSFIAALTSNFILNRFWTYPDSRSKSLQSQIVQYGLVNVIGLAIRTPVFIWADRSLAQYFATSKLSLSISSDVLAHNLALATAIGIVLFWNYFVNRYWTYSDVD